MATHYIDPPGPLTNTNEPIDFTTDYEVTSISIEFDPSLGTGRRETVFDGTDDVDNSGGDFSFLYRESTRQGSGPYTWRIVRTGRWPSDFRIRVKEATSAVPVDLTLGDWELMYERDMRSLPDQTISSASEYLDVTIDGKPWTSHIGGTGGSVAVVNGLGLRLTAAPGAFKQPGNPYAGVLAFIRTADWVGLDLTKEIALAVRFGGPTPTDDYTSPSELGMATYSGVHSWGLGGNGAPSYIINPIFGGSFGGTLNVAIYRDLTSLITINRPAAANPNDLSVWSMAVAAHPFDGGLGRVEVANLRSAWWGYDATVGQGHVSPATMHPLTMHNGVGTGENGSWMLGVYTGNRALSAPRSVYITHVRVLQRKAR